MQARTPEALCSGGRRPGVNVSDDMEVGACPVCGGRFRLGYALLLPVHTSRPHPPRKLVSFVLGRGFRPDR
jgi:hypothetical protein